MSGANSLNAALDAADLADGATISFHHHLRNGDGVLNAVLDACAARGLRNLHVAASSLFPVHAPLVDHIRSGVVTRISAGFVSGPVGEAVSQRLLPHPVQLQTHGGRARAIDQRALQVDAAFIAASGADRSGNLTGRSGPRAFGAMGYPQPDARAADCVIGVTDHRAAFDPDLIDIPANLVSHVAELDRIGDPGGISSGTTRPAIDPVSRAIGEMAAQVIAQSGVLKDGFSFQTGAGGISLAAAQAVGQTMAQRGIRGDFASGGITGFHVALLQAGLFRRLLDVQCFDLAAVTSICADPRHQGISASAYAGPHVGGAVVDRLSAVILGAAEVDEAFNVNVTTRADGVLMGGSGGHADTAEGAALTVITTRLTAAGWPKLVDRVRHVTTAGRHVDAVVTEAGVAVNPAHEALRARLQHAGLPLVEIGDLVRMAAQAGRPRPAPRTGQVVAQSLDRHGVLTDVLRA
ncbi:citrate lyase subunit alpha [Tropicibacter oceani]|uniref:Citrate lyase subunit alpha n=1 Tax=Tropicibacter oceani TaxID=3058420 RepID=A0ABY8QKW1_9RHOB|nr:citrate lyase subunit alpha [Tropicibacter oceani]WGW05169.1 citrate lyase subunit alpha [Tropicibacter oceani]